MYICIRELERESQCGSERNISTTQETYKTEQGYETDQNAS